MLTTLLPHLKNVIRNTYGRVPKYKRYYVRKSCLRILCLKLLHVPSHASELLFFK